MIPFLSIFRAKVRSDPRAWTSLDARGRSPYARRVASPLFGPRSRGSLPRLPSWGPWCEGNGRPADADLARSRSISSIRRTPNWRLREPLILLATSGVGESGRDSLLAVLDRDDARSRQIG